MDAPDAAHLFHPDRPAAQIEAEPHPVNLAIGADGLHVCTGWRLVSFT